MNSKRPSLPVLTWKQRKAQLRQLLRCSGDTKRSTSSFSHEKELGNALDLLYAPKKGEGDSAGTMLLLRQQVDLFKFSETDLEIIGALAQGQFGIVELVKCRIDGRAYVRKKMEKRVVVRARDQCSPVLERTILTRAWESNSPWIPKILAAFHSDESMSLSIVMQYAEAGSLEEVLESCPGSGGTPVPAQNGASASDGRLHDKDIRWWMPQCVSAIEWCHSQGFVHRDIKPQNFVLTLSPWPRDLSSSPIPSTPFPRLLLVDFGSAAPLLPPREDGVQLLPESYCRVPCGTCDYISPEILAAHEEALVELELDMDNGGTTHTGMDSRINLRRKETLRYGRETDWWSLGAMLYEMTYGVAPFFARDIATTYNRITAHERSLKMDKKGVSVAEDLKSFIRSLLTRAEDRLGRYSAKEVKSHYFFRDTDWSHLYTHQPPENLHIPEFTYVEPSPKVEHTTNNDVTETADLTGTTTPSKHFAFSALFQSSIDDVSERTSPALSLLRANNAAKDGSPYGSVLNSSPDFVGFSWGPTDDAFDDVVNGGLRVVPGQRSPYPSMSSLHLGPGHLSTPGAGIFSTPIRPGGGNREVSSLPITLPRPSTIRRSVVRRAVSDREAMKQLVNCVGMSARKRVLESGRKPKILLNDFKDVGITALDYNVKSMDEPTQTLRGGLSRQPSLSFKHKKELRFDATTNTTVTFAASDPIVVPSRVPDLRFDSESVTSSTETEELMSPSPSPRPGSAMSMWSRRSSTPTTGSASLAATAALSASRTSSPYLEVTQPTYEESSEVDGVPDETQEEIVDGEETYESDSSNSVLSFNEEDLDNRHRILADQVEDIERRLDELLLRMQGR